MKNILAIFLNILFPRSCTGCGKADTTLCKSCFAELAPAEFDEENQKARALWDYKNSTVKKVIWALKYRCDRNIVKLCAEALYEEILGELGEAHVGLDRERPLLVPIPISRGRRRERGFNQGELLARALRDIDKERSFIVRTDILEKIKETPRQTTIKERAKRLKNVRGCFAVLYDADLSGKTILLIDDVYTTGGTLAEAKKVLREAGARKIIAFTLAH